MGVACEVASKWIWVLCSGVSNSVRNWIINECECVCEGIVEAQIGPVRPVPALTQFGCLEAPPVGTVWREQEVNVHTFKASVILSQIPI